MIERGTKIAGEGEGGDHPIRFGRRFWAAKSLTREKQAAFKRMKERQALNHARGGRNWKERDGNHKAKKKEKGKGVIERTSECEEEQGD